MYTLFEEAIQYVSKNKVQRCEIQRDLVEFHIDVPYFLTHIV